MQEIENTLFMDLETYSEANIKLGSFRYASDKSTEIICLAYCFGVDGEVKLWLPTQEVPQDVIEHINNNGIIRSWNVGFEYALINYCGHRLYTFPKIKIEQTRCTASDALALALPASLDMCGSALDLDIVKDKIGKSLINKLSKPRKATKNKRYTRITPEIEPELFNQFYEYCRQDVRSEIAIYKYLPRYIKDLELKTFHQTLEINERGIPVNKKLVYAVIEDKEKYIEILDNEISEITNGFISSTNSRPKSLAWLDENNCELEGYTKDDIQKALQRDDLTNDVKRFLEIRSELSRTPIKKYDFLKAAICEDDTIKNNLVYHKATTGRFCLDKDSEILTKYGWVTYNNWGGEEIAIWDKNKKIIFEEVNINAWEYRGEMISVENRFCSQLVTPEHRLPYFSSSHNFFSLEAKELIGRGLSKLPASGFFTGETEKDLKTRILVMIQADGHYAQGRCNRHYLLLTFVKDRKIKKCRDLLKKSEINYKENRIGRKTTFRVSYKEMPKWLYDFREKQFDIYNLDELNLKSFIEEIPLWDGCRQEGVDSFEYSTCSKVNAEYVATVAHLTGMSARIIKRNRLEKNWSDSYRVYIRPQNGSRITPSHSSVKEYNGVVFCPETSTGFFLVRRKGLISITGNSSTGLQMQNLPRAAAENPEELISKFITREPIGNRNIINEGISLVRNVLCAKEGHRLVVSDFSSIENRVLAWLAGDRKTLIDFENKVVQYKVMASSIYNVKYDDVTKEQRSLGKILVLGAGFGAGGKAFVKVCEGYGVFIDEERGKELIDIYRNHYYKVPKLWYGLIGAAKEAVTSKKVTQYGHIKFRVMGDFLYMRLPNGRLLAYYKPIVKNVMAPWGKEVLALTHMGTNTYTRKWERLNVTPGRIAENLCQAVARDILTEAMIRAENKGFTIIGAVHDEIITHVKKDSGLNLEVLNDIMAVSPDWCKDLPISAEGFEGEFYKKE